MYKRWENKKKEYQNYRINNPQKHIGLEDPDYDADIGFFDPFGVYKVDDDLKNLFSRVRRARRARRSRRSRRMSRF
jgi:hypothetical protein